jgi:hypothetical protein
MLILVYTNTTQNQRLQQRCEKQKKSKSLRSQFIIKCKVVFSSINKIRMCSSDPVMFLYISLSHMNMHLIINVSSFR